MTPTLWLGVVVMVCMLECLRIGLTTYVLLHLLQDRTLRRPGEDEQQAVLSLKSARARARREALFDPTLTALRSAMDDVAAGRSGPAIGRAIAALDRYAQALVEERGVA